jgi:phosphatidylglycerophosphatase A
MTTPRPALDWRFLRAHPAYFLAFGFGAGLARRAPGTWGSLVGLALYFPLAALTAPVYWLVVAGALIAGVWLCGKTGAALGVHDHGGIVWDEIVAMLMVLPFAPPAAWGYVLAFALFRLFDIWKPFPIAWCDARLPGGFGVMFDDVLAAGYAVLCLLGMSAWS